MNHHPTPPHPHIPPFQRRQRPPGPPLPRFSQRAAKFYGIRSRLPPLTSRAACARFRLSRKTAAPPLEVHTADPHSAAIQYLHNQLEKTQRQLVDLLDTTIPVIHTPNRASSLCCLPGVLHHSHITHTCTPSSSTPLQFPLEPAAPSPRAHVDFRWILGDDL
ncbi:hypothetical protein C8J57DRAFT_1276241 [Mycena rebaudengoi]|nr:hypothetical protein C8J57DRAFT_1276241 [Mycena rebaudengoi]